MSALSKGGVSNMALKWIILPSTHGFVDLQKGTLQSKQACRSTATHTQIIRVNYRAVAHTSASLPALFSCLSPFLTGFLAFVILGERVGSISDIIGLLLNLGGLMSVIYSKMRLEKPIPVVGMANHVVHGDRVDGINSSPDTYLTEAKEPERKESHDVTKPMVPNGIFLRPGTPSAF